MEHIEREIIKFSQYLTVSDKVLIFKKTFRFLLNTLSKSESKVLISNICNYTNCSNTCPNRYFCERKLHVLYARSKKFPIIANRALSLNVEFKCKILSKKEVTFIESKKTIVILKNLAKLLHSHHQEKIFTEYFIHRVYGVKIRTELPSEFQIGRCNFKCSTGHLCKRQTGKTDFYCNFPNHRFFAIYNKFPVNQAVDETNFKIIEKICSENKPANNYSANNNFEDDEENEEEICFENCCCDNCDNKGVFPDISFPEMKFCKRHVGLDPIESYSVNGTLILETVKLIQKAENPVERLNLANSIQFGYF
jgi:hypothetical protein